MLKSQEVLHGAWFVHGMLEDEQTWGLLLAQLAARDPKVPRFPWSAQNGPYWGVDAGIAHWIEQIDDPQQPPPMLMVAHSFGCSALLEYLLERPERQPQALVLVSPFFRKSKDQVDWDTVRGLFDGLEGLIAESVRMADRGGRYGGALLDTVVKRVRDRLGVYGWIQALQSFLRAPDWPLADLRSRTLVLAGLADSYCPAGGAAQLADGLAGSRLHLIADGGHFVHLTHAREVAEEISRFLDLPRDHGVKQSNETAELR